MASGIHVEMIQMHIFRRRQHHGIEYLLIRRAKDEPVLPGMWQMVTGYMEKDEAASDAAIREMKEDEE